MNMKLIRAARRGVTLIEVLVASAILAVLVLVAFMVLMNGITDGTNTSIENRLNARGAEMLQRFRDDFGFGKVMAVLDDHRTIQFQISIYHPVNGVNPEYWTLGYRNPNAVGTTISNPPQTTDYLVDSWSCKLTAEVDGVIRESAGAPAIPFAGTPQTMNFDINGNGNLNDSFAVCRWRWQVLDNAVPPVVQATFYSDDSLLLCPQSSSNPALDGDVNKDGVNDPLFVLQDANGIEVQNAQASLAGRRVQVTMHHGLFDTQGKHFIIRRSQDTIRLDLKQNQ